MRKMILGMMVVIGLLGMMAGTGMCTSTDTAHILLLVTPNAIVDLSISTGTIVLGVVDVGKSTVTWQSVVMTNIGSTGFTLEKTVMTDGDLWDITAAPAIENGFNLFAMATSTSATNPFLMRPSITDFETAASSFNKAGVGLSYLNALTYIDKTKVNMAPTGSTSKKNIWFRLDMPTKVSNTNQQSINVRLKASTN